MHLLAGPRGMYACGILLFFCLLQLVWCVICKSSKLTHIMPPPAPSVCFVSYNLNETLKNCSCICLYLHYIIILYAHIHTLLLGIGGSAVHSKVRHPLFSSGDLGDHVCREGGQILHQQSQQQGP